MDCRLCREHINEYIENKLDEKHMLQFAYHLTQCPDCRREVAQTIQMNQLLDDWQTPELSSSFHRNLNARLEKERQSKWWAHLWNPLPMRLVAIGAAACIAMVVSFTTMRPDMDNIVANQDVVDLAIIENADVLDEMELLEHIELFENWDVIEQLDDLVEGQS